MELNAEQIKYCLELILKSGMGMSRDGVDVTDIRRALALIKSQEQKIFELENRLKECENGYEGTIALERAKVNELTEENERLRYEQGKLIDERNTYREYAEKMQLYVEKINHKEEEGYEPSAARYAEEMDMWRSVALEKKRLTEENEMLQAEITHLEGHREADIKAFKTLKADTVRKVQERLKKAFNFGHTILEKSICDIIDQIAKEIENDEL